MTSIEFWQLLVDSIATILAATAILIYVIFWYRDKTMNSYDIFDSTYMELLKLAMDHPTFRLPEVTENYQTLLQGEQKVRYELYAFMCWNFCETIYDKGDKKLMETWSVVIEAESQLHATWFAQPQNKSKFKKAFSDYIALLSK